MQPADPSTILQQLKEISGHDAWVYEGGRYTAVRMSATEIPRISAIVKNALSGVATGGRIIDITTQLNVRHDRPNNDGSDYFDSVSIGEASLDTDKLAAAAERVKTTRSR